MILEKSQKRLVSWKSASLSFAGRCTLIKTVASALPIYAMQTIKLPSEICANLDKINRNFLWGSTDEKKRMHLVNWDMVCMPKKRGGLGIKKMKMMNQSLLAKAGWRISQKENGLWAHILRAKYLKGGHNIADYKKMTSCSSTWRGIVAGNDFLLKGLRRRVGDGCNIGFWTDDWVPEFGKLLRFAIPSLSNDQICEKVSDYLLPNSWNMQKLYSALPEHVVHRILSIHAGSMQSVCDRVIWGLTKGGEFTVKSAYEEHFREDDMPPWDWNFIWKLRLPPRVSHFLWIFLHAKLLTNIQRATRGLTLETACIRCKGDSEDSEHVFRGCAITLIIWDDVCKGSTRNGLFVDDWKDWISQNLRCSKLVFDKYPNHLLFVVALWFIWKWRCEHVFNPNFNLPACPGKIILKFVEDWWMANYAVDTKDEKKTCLLVWNPPAQEWVKLNVDGSMNPDSGSIAAGGVFRDHKKNWLGGFALNKGVGSAIEAEVWGIFEGLKIAWKAVKFPLSSSEIYLEGGVNRYRLQILPIKKINAEYINENAHLIKFDKLIDFTYTRVNQFTRYAINERNGR